MGNGVIQEFSTNAWRENFMRTILRGAALFGLIALIPTYLANTPLISLVIYVITYIILLLAAFIPLPYWVRAWTFVIITYALGLVNLLNTGIWGDGRVFFLALVIVASLLFSHRVSISIALVTLVTTAVIGWLVLSGNYAITSTAVQPSDLLTWVTEIGVLVMLDAIFILGLMLLQNGFAQAQQRSAQALTELEVERKSLEERVELRTHEIQQVTNQLRIASSITRQISDIRDLSTILNTVVSLLADHFDLYHVGIFLLDDNQHYAVLQAASSVEGRKMIETGYRVEIGNEGVLTDVVKSKRSRIIEDAGAGPASLGSQRLPLSRSEISIPMLARERVIGVLDVQSDISGSIHPDFAESLQTVANQLATTIENTRLLNETEAIINQFEALTSLQSKEAWQNYLKRRTAAYQYTPLGIRPLTDAAPVEKTKTLKLPLQLRGQEIGAINLRRKQDAPDWSQNERELAQDIAAQVALALENSRLLEETQDRAAREQIIGEITARLSRTMDIDTLLQTAARDFGALPEVAEVSVFLGKPNEQNVKKGRK